MKTRVVSFLFFSNYFIGLLAVALCIETIFQLRLPLNAASFYLLIFSTTILFYTRAYSPAPDISVANNPRTSWYIRYRGFTGRSQWMFSLVALGSLVWQVLLIKKIPDISAFHWLLLIIIPAVAGLYYGLWPQPGFTRLRHIGWLKPFVIGYVWAGVVCIFPVTALIFEKNIYPVHPYLMLWLFVKNWMFCSVNAIMFDLKDYADDANKDIKTFVVKIGLRKTIFVILIPLLLLGFISFLFFSWYNHFNLVTIAMNALPFLLLLYLAFSLHKRRPILYYLVVIDGALLVKAVCGIIAAFVTYR